jgi:hypothetical protein
MEPCWSEQIDRQAFCRADMPSPFLTTYIHLLLEPENKAER